MTNRNRVVRGVPAQVRRECNEMLVDLGARPALHHEQIVAAVGGEQLERDLLQQVASEVHFAQLLVRELAAVGWTTAAATATRAARGASRYEWLEDDCATTALDVTQCDQLGRVLVAGEQREAIDHVEMFLAKQQHTWKCKQNPDANKTKQKEWYLLRFKNLEK